MVIVTHTIFVAGWRSSRLDAPNQSSFDQDTQSIVHSLFGNDTQFCSDYLGNTICRDVRLA
jgi:hypothetical protein